MSLNRRQPKEWRSQKKKQNKTKKDVLTILMKGQTWRNVFIVDNKCLWNECPQRRAIDVVDEDEQDSGEKEVYEGEDSNIFRTRCGYQLSCILQLRAKT